MASSAALAAGGSQFYDLNIFPIALIKRIEVLKDGASATYGSDAVGGVVNVIMDDDFVGLQMGGRYGWANQSSVADSRYDLLAGFNNEHTRIVFGIQRYRQDPLLSNQRHWATPSYGTTTYGGIVRSAGNFYQLNPGINSPAGNNPTPSATGAAITPAQTPDTLAAGTYSGTDFNSVFYGFDLSRFTTITLNARRLSVYNSFQQDLFDKNLTAFGDVLYSQTQNDLQLAAQPLSNAEGVVIPATAPYNPFEQISILIMFLEITNF